MTIDSEVELCGKSVYWWDGEYEGACELPKGHLEPFHFDGISYYDNGGEERGEEQRNLEKLIAQEANKAVEAKNYAYWERNQLVSVLSRLYPSHLARHDENDKEWEDDWRNIVCVHTPVGQATWHLQDNDMPMFAHLKRGADHWDGHTTEEKYHRLAQLTADKELNNG